MDFIYSIDLSSYISDDELKPTDSCSCALSSRNILAIANDCCVYVLPLEKPNELIPVNLSNSPCVYLSWSEDGLYLLSICKNGVCRLHNIKTNLLNQIDLVFSFQINKNELICVKPFSKQPKLCWNYDKNDSFNYLDKFYYHSFNSLGGLARLAFNGFLFLTKKGKIHLCLTDFNSIKNKHEQFEFDMKLSMPMEENSMDCESLNKDEFFFELGDFSCEADGSIQIAYSSPDITAPIYLYQVFLRFNNEGNALEGTCELTNTINLNYEHLASKSRILFMSNEMSRLLFVSLNNEDTNLSCLQFWQSSNELFDSTITAGTSWYLVNTIQCPGQISGLKVPKNEISFRKFKKNDQDLNFYLLAAYNNGTIGFIDTRTFDQSFLTPIPGKQDHLESKHKVTKPEYLITLDQSHSGLVGVGITNRCNLIAFRQLDFKTIQMMPSSAPMSNLINLYEHCLLTGYDYWDLLVCTNPRLIESLMETLEQNYSNQTQPSIKRAYFSQFYSLLYALSRRGLVNTQNQFRSLDILIKLILNRCMSIMSYSIQISLNTESLITMFSNSNANLVNTSQSVPLINTSLLSSNIDYINNQTFPNSPANSFVHIPIKTSLSEYFNEILKLDSNSHTNLNELKLNEIVQSVVNRKNSLVVFNQQLKHLAQWIIDVTLNLVNVFVVTTNKSNNSYNNIDSCGLEPDFLFASLLSDYSFLNELRKGLLFIKLMFSVSQSNINLSLPILPHRSITYQKDLLAELFSVLTKFISRINDTTTVNDESLVEQCVCIQADTIINELDKKFFNLMHSWFGLTKSSWQKTFQFSVDHLFSEEKSPVMYPLFDVARLIQFSRSNLTKQCIRCGNYTEGNSASNTASNAATAQTNTLQTSKMQSCIHMQELSADRCVCGGFWVFSPIY